MSILPHHPSLTTNPSLINYAFQFLANNLDKVIRFLAMGAEMTQMVSQLMGALKDGLL
jgi:hypothetical protein